MEKADWRYERKFRVQLLNRAAVEAWLRSHPAGFSKAFPDRHINNIYYDTADLRCYAENMAGINERRKFRIRWYGEDLQLVQKPTLEVKMKHNELGTKHSEKLSDFDIEELPIIDQLSSYVYNTGQVYLPSLCNRYYRSYFLSADQRYRITIDDQMQFQSPRQSQVQSDFWYEIPDVVIELKYNRDADDKVADITRHIPFRQTKNSKYASGLEVLHL